MSYDISPTKFPVGFHRSATYDDAIAALAFLIAGDADRAAFTLHALARLVRPDGSLWFAYNTVNNWPTESDHESALVRGGAVSWVGYALTFYAAHAPVRKGHLGDAHERAAFLETARHLAGYLLSLQVQDPNDPRHGLLRLGYGTNTLTYDTTTRRVMENYLDEPALGISTENNIVAWFFLRLLGRVSDEARWSDAADAIGHGLLGAAWNDGLDQFNEGFASGGAPDPVKALDCAALGALFLRARGENRKAGRALGALERYYPTRTGNVVGYRPYSDTPIYGDSSVGSAFFPDHPRIEWRELPVVWSEGSFQVALAYLRMGQARRAERVVRGLRALQSKTGGVRYATMDVPFEMSDAASVAGSAWLVLISRALSGDSLAQQIWR